MDCFSTDSAYNLVLAPSENADIKTCFYMFANGRQRGEGGRKGGRKGGTLCAREKTKKSPTNLAHCGHHGVTPRD